MGILFPRFPTRPPGLAFIDALSFRASHSPIAGTFSRLYLFFCKIRHIRHTNVRQPLIACRHGSGYPRKGEHLPNPKERLSYIQKECQTRRNFLLKGKMNEKSYHYGTLLINTKKEFIRDNQPLKGISSINIQIIFFICQIRPLFYSKTI